MKGKTGFEVISKWNFTLGKRQRQGTDADYGSSKQTTCVGDAANCGVILKVAIDKGSGCIVHVSTEIRDTEQV